MKFILYMLTALIFNLARAHANTNVFTDIVGNKQEYITIGFQTLKSGETPGYITGSAAQFAAIISIEDFKSMRAVEISNENLGSVSQDQQIELQHHVVQLNIKSLVRKAVTEFGEKDFKLTIRFVRVGWMSFDTSNIDSLEIQMFSEEPTVPVSNSPKKITLIQQEMSDAPLETYSLGDSHGAELNFYIQFSLAESI